MDDLDEPDPDELMPLDFGRLLANGIPEPDYLAYPYVVRGSRIWNFGATESAKSIYWQHVARNLTREGRTVAYFSAENPLATDLDRMSRLRPDFANLDYFHMPNIDLNVREDFVRVAEACAGSDLVVIDTLSALWSGDENSNKEVVAFDREVLVPLVRLTGAAIAIIHHTGHAQAFVNRTGASAGRGASAMGQKADVVLTFTSIGPHEFTIEHGKDRTPGGRKEPKQRFKVIDTSDGGLDIEPVGRYMDPRLAECVEAAVALVGATPHLSTNALTRALKDQGFGGSTIDQTFNELKDEQPTRVQQVDGMVIGKDGSHRTGRPWVPTPTDPDRPATNPGGR